MEGGAAQRVTSDAPADGRRAWNGKLDTRGRRGHCSPAGGVSRGLTDVVRVPDRLGFTAKRGG